MGSCNSADTLLDEPKVQELRSPSRTAKAWPVHASGILVYIRVGGLGVGRVPVDSAPLKLLREGFVCVLAELAETNASTVKDFGGHEAMLSLMPCRQALGLVFGGLLASVDLARHREWCARTIEDVRDSLSSDEARAQLEASAEMAAHLINPESAERSCVLDIYVAEGIPDMSGRLGENCPWDSEVNVAEGLRGEGVSEANVAGKKYGRRPCGLPRPPPVAELSSDRGAIKAPLRDIPRAATLKNAPEPFNDVTTNLFFDSRDTIQIADEEWGGDFIDTLVRLEATCSRLETSPCSVLDPQSACKPPKSCFSCVR